MLGRVSDIAISTYCDSSLIVIDLCRVTSCVIIIAWRRVEIATEAWGEGNEEHFDYLSPSFLMVLTSAVFDQCVLESTIQLNVNKCGRIERI